MKTDKDRREFLLKALNYGLFGTMGLSAMNGKVFAMGTKDYPQGMRKIEGEVRINDKPAQIGSTVKAGDAISTGPASLAIFVLEKDVYMLRENTRLELGSESSEQFKENAVNVLRLINGKMMAVFRKSPKRLETPTSVAGVRGTGLYAEAEAERSFLCLCYGTAEIQSKVRPDERETIRSQHHDMPRYICASGDPGKLISKAGGADHPNHTDEELIMLESFVGRTPPFINSGRSENGGGGGY